MVWNHLKPEVVKFQKSEESIQEFEGDSKISKMLSYNLELAPWVAAGLPSLSLQENLPFIQAGNYEPRTSI